MAVTNYNYTKVAVPARLVNEINASAIITALNNVILNGTNDLNVSFKDALSSGDVIILDALVAAHVPTAMPSPISIVQAQIIGTNSKISDPVLKGVIGSSGVTFISHDFADRTTWYQKSLRVTDETLTTSDNLTFNSANANWVNIYSKRLLFLRNKVTLRDGTFGKHVDFAVVVKIDSVIQTTGYTINFESGLIVFSSAVTGVVTCTYSHNNNVTNRSEWILCPVAGKSFYLDHVEVQFSKTVTFNTPVRFEVWAGNTVTYFTSNGWSDAIFDAGYGQMRSDYQDIRGLINHCNLGTGSIPACVNSGVTADVLVLPFDYVKAIALNGDQGVLARVSLVDDIPMTTSEISSVAFYTQVVTN